MRGEEVQILGALRLHPALAKGRHIFCMPGTHAKWVEVVDGAVTRFQTALSGELFELLRRHSVLARDGGEVDADSPALTLGLQTARQPADLLHLLFSARARVVTGEMPKGDAASYLSGLILGKDVATARGAVRPERHGASGLHAAAGGALCRGAGRLWCGGGADRRR